MRIKFSLIGRVGEHKKARKTGKGRKPYEEVDVSIHGTV